MPRSTFAQSTIRLSYVDGQGVLRAVLAECTRRDFTIGDLTIDQHEKDPRTVTVRLELRGAGAISELTAALAELEGILAVAGDDANTVSL